VEAVEVELLRAENDRLGEALKEMAIELTLHRGLSDAPSYLQWGPWGQDFPANSVVRV